jgi:hypothetical protein
MFCGGGVMSRRNLVASVIRSFFLIILLGASFQATAWANEAVSIRGSTLLRDGKPWVPKGVVVVALISAASTAGPVPPGYVRAREIWGPDEISAIKAFGADTVNLKASQPALDPMGGHYDPAYLGKLQAAVGLARQAGLNVILSMEWEKATGVPGQEEMPTDATVTAPVSSTSRAWQATAAAFGSDLGVMYQLFDEPCAKTDTPETWAQWQHGHQAAIDAVRGAGAKNVLVAEGIRCGKWLTNVPQLNDPLNAVAYAVHPYQMPQGVRQSPADNYTVEDFDRNFGRWQAKGHVVIATEWDMWSKTCHDGTDGNPTSPKIATDLLNYLKEHQIGLVLWGMDVPGTIWADQTWQSPTKMDSFDGCKGRRIGVGAMVRRYFLTGEVGVM